jgi:transposase
LTLPLRSRVHLRDYESHEHPMLRHRSQRLRLAWPWIAPYLLATRSGGRPRTIDPRPVLNAIFYLLRTGCQWRLLPREFPRPGTVYHYFRAWKDVGLLAELQGALHEEARLSRGRLPCPSVVILDSQSVKTPPSAEASLVWMGTNGSKGENASRASKYALCRLWAVNPGKAVVVPLIGLLVTPATGG